MGEMEDKLGAILNDPGMMKKIMSMASALQGSAQEEAPAEPQMPPVDMAMLQKFAGLASQSGIDNREQALLGALRAYLSRERVSKLEKAMRAAKLAKLASGALGQGMLQSMSGR